MHSSVELGSITSHCSGNEPALLPRMHVLGEGKPDMREQRESSLVWNKLLENYIYI